MSKQISEKLLKYNLFVYEKQNHDDSCWLYGAQTHIAAVALQEREMDLNHRKFIRGDELIKLAWKTPARCH
jgi:hypothetical protein